MYKIELEKDQLHDLYLLREYGGGKSIVGMVKRSVTDFIQKEIEKMGCSPVELREIVEKHEREKERSPL